MIKIKKLNDKVKLPIKAKDGDAGFDVFSLEEIKLDSGEKHSFALGFALEILPNNVMLIQEKSGLAIQGIMTIGNVIDSGYRGECHAILVNISNNPIIIKKGQKIAQMLLIPCYTGKEIVEVKELSETERGVGGFGSTGIF